MGARQTGLEERSQVANRGEPSSHFCIFCVFCVWGATLN